MTRPAAVHELRSAIKGWREVGAPYELARAQAVLSRALRAGRQRGRCGTRAAAQRSMRSGGSAPASMSKRPSAELRDAEDRRSGPVTARKTFMFTDIVGSTNLAEAIGDEAWERLLRWHDDMLRSQVAKGAGRSSIRPATASSRPSTRRASALDCAISIQRALVDHRASTGFALSVRIGLHTRRGQPARHATTAARWVSTWPRVSGRLRVGGGDPGDRRDTRRGGAASPPRTRGWTPVKGVAEPVSVSAVTWN